MIETASAYISKIDEHTVKVIFKTDARLSMEEYNQLYDFYMQVLDKEKKDDIKLLIIVQAGFSMEKKYMNFFTKVYKTNFKKAEAYMIMDPSAQMFFKVGVKLIKQKYPVKLFDNEAEALSWLKSIK